jgi:glutathione S-transferase
VQRRLVREVDQYAAPAVGRLGEVVLSESPSAERVAAALAEILAELERWETAISGDHLAGALSAADFSLYPSVAIIERFVRRRPELLPAVPAGPKISGWMKRMAALPVVQKTWPPHWR